MLTQHAAVNYTYPPQGCQRSGSNWLRTMLGEREDLIAPHPPHILREFLPILSKFGDLEEIENLKVRHNNKQKNPATFVSISTSNYISLMHPLLLLPPSKQSCSLTMFAPLSRKIKSLGLTDTIDP